MKRFSMAMTWLALAGLMTMVSCRKPVVGFTNGESRTVTVSAVTESGGGSKTAIEGLKVNWSKGDKIRMNAGSVLTLEDECAGSTMGRFTGEVTDDGPYYIGYPEDKTTYSGTTLKLNIPASWAYAEMKEIVPMVAYAASVDDDVYFRNAVNMLKLQLKGDGTAASKLTSIKLTSTTSNLSGKIEVTFDEGGNPTFNAIAGDGASKTMTVSFGDGLQLGETVQCVYIPLARIGSGEVLTVRFDCVKGSMEKKLTATEGFSDVNNMLSAPELMMGHEYVDLGLPSGLLWATCNVGASKPEDCGDYFAWGDTETQDYYEWSTYKWYNGSSYALTKYCTDSNWGTVDNKTVLDLEEDDAAGANWGGGWRMPTTAEWKELYDNTECTWTTENSVNGRKFTSKTDSSKYIFLPAAGYRDCSGLINAGSYGFYWSSSLFSSFPNHAYYMSFGSDNVTPHSTFDRFCGFTVRPVREF